MPKIEPLTTQPLAAHESQRSILLEHQIVPYLLRRSTRRSIGLSIDRRGLRVAAPQRANLADIEALIVHHAHWVLQKLSASHARENQARLEIADGVHLPFLGQSLHIHLTQGQYCAQWHEHAPDAPQLSLSLPAHVNASRAVEKALRDKALLIFAQRLAFYAPLLAVKLPPLALSGAKTRWGSCSRKTGIRLNWRLIHFPVHLIDYVVVHELAHLHEMNHSPRFWALVQRFCPDYRALRRELQQIAATLPRWDAADAPC